MPILERESVCVSAGAREERVRIPVLTVYTGSRIILRVESAGLSKYYDLKRKLLLLFNTPLFNA